MDDNLFLQMCLKDERKSSCAVPAYRNICKTLAWQLASLLDRAEQVHKLAPIQAFEQVQRLVASTKLVTELHDQHLPEPRTIQATMSLQILSGSYTPPTSLVCFLLFTTVTQVCCHLLLFFHPQSLDAIENDRCDDMMHSVNVSYSAQNIWFNIFLFYLFGFPFI